MMNSMDKNRVEGERKIKRESAKGPFYPSYLPLQSIYSFYILSCDK